MDIVGVEAHLLILGVHWSEKSGHYKVLQYGDSEVPKVDIQKEIQPLTSVQDLFSRLIDVSASFADINLKHSFVQGDKLILVYACCIPEDVHAVQGLTWQSEGLLKEDHRDSARNEFNKVTS